jgi:hypothetical protein
MLTGEPARVQSVWERSHISNEIAWVTDSGQEPKVSPTHLPHSTTQEMAGNLTFLLCATCTVSACRLETASRSHRRKMLLMQLRPAGGGK